MFLSYIDIFLSLPSSLSESNDEVSSGEDKKKRKKRNSLNVFLAHKQSHQVSIAY